MKERWAFLLSLALAVLALCFQCWYRLRSSDAKQQLTEYWMAHPDPDKPPTREAMDEALRVAGNLPATAQRHRALVAAEIGMAGAAMSGLGMLLSRRRKEAAPRWLVGCLLFLYFLLGSL